jgi:integrase
MRGLNERFELQRMDGVAPVPLSFAHDEFLIACGRLAKSTLLDYMNTLSMLERMLGSSTLVPDITVAHIDRFLDTGHSESTEAKHYRNLRRFFRWCRTRGYCNLIPTEQVTVKPRVGIREITMPTDAQINTLVEACECSTLRIALMIGLTTGLDRGVVARLNRDNFDLESRTIRVRRQKTKRSNPVTIVLPLHQQILPGVASLLQSQPAPLPLFPGYLSRRWWRELCNAAGHPWPQIRVSDLRKIASARAQRLMPLASVARLLGHSTVATTSRHYTPADPATLAAIDELTLPPLQTPSQTNTPKPASDG